MASKGSKALGDAAAGAAVGTAFMPGIGTAIGAGAGGLMGLLSGDDDNPALDTLANTRDIYGNLSMPDLQKFKPEEFQYSGDYKPELADATTVQEDPSIRSGQLSALSKMAGLSDTGFSDVDQAGFQNARNIGNQMLNSGNQAAMQNAQARGIGGSGMEFAMREMANQQGAQNAQQAGLQQASQGALMRQNALQNYAMGEGNLRSQDFSNNAANAGILNQFNMANTNNQNYAQQANLQNRQQQMNNNTQLNNSAQQYNNSLAQQQYNNQYQKAAGMAGANTQYGQGQAASQAADQSNTNSNLGLAATVGMGIAANRNAPQAPKYDTKTGQALYDPQTGQAYQ